MTPFTHLLHPTPSPLPFYNAQPGSNVVGLCIDSRTRFLSFCRRGFAEQKRRAFIDIEATDRFHAWLNTNRYTGDKTRAILPIPLITELYLFVRRGKKKEKDTGRRGENSM